MHFLENIEDHQNIEISSLDVEEIDDDFRINGSTGGVRDVPPPNSFPNT